MKVTVELSANYHHCTHNISIGALVSLINSNHVQKKKESYKATFIANIFFYTYSSFISVDYTTRISVQCMNAITRARIPLCIIPSVSCSYCVYVCVGSFCKLYLGLDSSIFSGALFFQTAERFLTCTMCPQTLWDFILVQKRLDVQSTNPGSGGGYIVFLSFYLHSI